MTLDEIRTLAQNFQAARDAFYAFGASRTMTFGNEDYDPLDESEEQIRWRITYDRLCSASVKAERPYRDACDRYFTQPEIEPELKLEPC